MITLPQQIQAVVVHLMAGWLFGFLSQFHNSFWILLKGKKRKFLIDLFAMGCFVCGLFAVMFQINGGRTHPYLLTILLIGLLIYKFVYNPIFASMFHFVEQSVKFIFIRFSLAFSPLSSIIKLLRKKAKGGKKHGKSAGKSNRSENAP